MAVVHNIQAVTPLSLVPVMAEPALELPAEVDSSLAIPEKSQDLQSAFELFNQMSQQLTDSYFLLENRVAELNQELNSVADQRLKELAEKEKIANRLENLLNFLPGGVVVLDSRGRVSECNPAALDLLVSPCRGSCGAM